MPNLPDSLLPESLRPWLADVAERTQIPLEYVAVPAVVALGSLLGRTAGIRPKERDTWTVVPNLWGGIIGRPGLLKSPAINEAVKPLWRLSAAAHEDFKLATYRAGYWTYEAALPTETWQRMWPALGTNLGQEGQWHLYAAATFDHEILERGIHEWIQRRWTTFNLSVHSFTAVLVAQVTVFLEAIDLTWPWGLMTLALLLTFFATASIASGEDGALCIALVKMDDSLTPLDSGILCAKLKPEITQDQAEVLLDHMNEVIDSWEMKRSPGPPDDPGHGIVVPLKRAA